MKYFHAPSFVASAISYQIPNVPNYNQYEAGAPVGCEGVSLYQALQAKGDVDHYSLHTFLTMLPKAATPDQGFVGSPFVADAKTYTAIYAAPLANFGKQFGQVVNLPEASLATIEAEVTAGNPVVAYVTEHFAAPRFGQWSFGRVVNNNHAVTVAGFNRLTRKLYVSDPIDGQYWISASKFAAAYNVRHMAVVVR
ncbi:C39 family peptidase [Lacticaseibacillus nasuensis]|uniref:C39 family peptidase n=1 Tax=Lacticaseibacillus nasuensis TaxID=944671 RepID=UPI002248692A|nr:C39 family peptidase [Lacticaseibacillus nasuensis]MCX2454642.1 C39 family peptidase [Lacticaseibacillus nasuensis]